MKWTTLKRIVRAGWISFRRNGWLSTATIMVMVLVLFVLGNLLFVGAFAAVVLTTLESKIDISVYFLTSASEEEILMVKREIESIPEVAGVSYVSQDIALETFRERHRANALISAALEEVGVNPLEASLNVRARDPSRYAAISEFLLHKNYPVVDKINYFDNRQVIERLGGMLATIRGTGAFLAVFLAFIAVLVAFNTIRLAIYTMREEIGIMRFVGATRWFVRGPFLVSGLLYGTAATLVTAAIFFPLTWLLAPKLLLLLPTFDLFRYFLIHFWEFFGILLATGIALGVISSSIAIRRYLEA